jgi:hypothetical protein
MKRLQILQAWSERGDERVGFVNCEVPHAIAPTSEAAAVFETTIRADRISAAANDYHRKAAHRARRERRLIR